MLLLVWPLRVSWSGDRKAPSSHPIPASCGTRRVTPESPVTRGPHRLLPSLKPLRAGNVGFVDSAVVRSHTLARLPRVRPDRRSSI